MRKIDDVTASEIRARHGAGEMASRIALDYGVSEQAVTRIVRYETHRGRRAVVNVLLRPADMQLLEEMAKRAGTSAALVASRLLAAGLAPEPPETPADSPEPVRRYRSDNKH